MYKNFLDVNVLFLEAILGMGHITHAIDYPVHDISKSSQMLHT